VYKYNYFDVNIFRLWKALQVIVLVNFIDIYTALPTANLKIQDLCKFTV